MAKPQDFDQTLFEGHVFWRRDVKDKWEKYYGKIVLLNTTRLGLLHAIRVVERSKGDERLVETITISKELVVVGPLPDSGKFVFHLANGRKEMHLATDKNSTTNEWIDKIKQIAVLKKDKEESEAPSNAEAPSDSSQAGKIDIQNPQQTPPRVVGASGGVVGTVGAPGGAGAAGKPQMKRKTSNPKKTKSPPVVVKVQRPIRNRANGEDQGKKKFVGISMAQVRAKQLLEDAQKLRETKKDFPECQNLPKLTKPEYQEVEEVPPLEELEDEAPPEENAGGETAKIDIRKSFDKESENRIKSDKSPASPPPPGEGEEAKRLEEIQKKGGLPDLKDFITPTSVFIKDGKLKVQVQSIKNTEKGKRKEERHFILFNDLFLHVKKKLFDHEKIEDECVWPLELLWLDDTGPKIKMTGPSGDQLTFTNKHEWGQILKKSIQTQITYCNSILGPKRQCTEQIRVGSFTFADGSSYTGQWIEGKRQGRGIWKSNGASYNGEWKDDKMEGKGKYTYPTGDCYFGYFSDGKPDGVGSLKYSDGSQFLGHWQQGIRKGAGILKFENGDVFKGIWKGDKISAGKLKCVNGLKYEGTFQNNLFESIGILTDPNQNEYEGEFKLGLKSGRGSLKESNGAHYCGEFVNNLRHGKGTYVYADGSKYIGEWENDIPEGEGRMEYSDGTIYEGRWINGLRSGKGRCSYPNDAYYEGDWLLDRHNGEGEYRESTGIVYKGTWEKGIKQGNGKFIYLNGATYTGPVRAGLYDGKGGSYVGGEGDYVKSFTGAWINGAMHGNGVVTFINNDTYEGHLKNNTFHGDGVFTTNGLSYDGKWEMGVLMGKTTFTHGGVQIQGNTVSNHLLSSNARPLNIPPTLYTPNFLTSPILSMSPKKYV